MRKANLPLDLATRRSLIRRIRAVSVESWGKSLIEVGSKGKGEEESKTAYKDKYFKEFCCKREERNIAVAGEGAGLRENDPVEINK